MAKDRIAEQKRLARVAADSWYANGVATTTVAYPGEVFARHFSGSSCLELGPAEGVMTEILSATFPFLTLVDEPEQFCEQFRERYPDVEVIHSLFEGFTPDRPFDAIVLG
jgi:hypothetical protein